MLRTIAKARFCAVALPLVLGGCQTVDVLHIVTPRYEHGKVVLCATPASIGPAAVIVTDMDRNRPGVETVPRDTPAEGVCAAVNKAALDAGFKTVYDIDKVAGVKIISADPDRIRIEAKNVRLSEQQF